MEMSDFGDVFLAGERVENIGECVRYHRRGVMVPLKVSFLDVQFPRRLIHVKTFQGNWASPSREHDIAEKSGSRSTVSRRWV
jgi:hypothetical protein